MNFISSLIGYPLGWVMWFLFKVVRNYGVALFLFTVFARLIMVPTTVKQQKTSAKMVLLRPQMEEIQKKYAKNKEKLNEELMKLYQQEKYNPMSGCLPLLIQFPILFGLINVIYNPLNHIVRISAEAIQRATEIATQAGILAENLATSAQLKIVEGVSQQPELFLSGGLEQEVVDKIMAFAPQLNFLGINLMETPSMSMFSTFFSSFNPVILIPILSGATSLLMSFITMRHTSATTEGQAGAGSMKGMMLMMPIFSTWFTFSVPAGVGLYWTYSNVVGIAQSMIIHKIYNPKEMAEQARIEFEERKERERLERIEAKKKAKEGALEDTEKALSQKELNRKKLAEARKRDAERYGDVYNEGEE